ncbi:SdrD B-like domain-containing protein [Baekduia sp.]|jgi:hypothetical protein|uniref:SdrD B-like domain-containing protein n=1 Tax=Baekduia sp. TaxID=2600305 RepID=UPI002E04AC28|nr:SdrD B-like domain-containing protein [Baekduia sp.]
MPRRAIPHLATPQLLAAIGAALVSLVVSAGTADAAAVSGRVFHDYNTNGILDTDAGKGAIDTGVPGLTVRAVQGTATVVATTTTAADGSYTLTAPAGRVRIDLTVPLPWWPTRQLNGLRSDEQFVDARSPVTGADFGVHLLREWSIDNPLVFWPVQWGGPPTGPEQDRDGIRGMPYFTTPATSTTFTAQPDKVVPATFGQVGTLYGLGLDQRTGSLYAGAYYKRYAGLTADGPGAIFRVGQVRTAGSVRLWAKLPAGADAHPTSTSSSEWFGAAPAHRDMTWDLVGKRGLGSVEVDPDDDNVYTINLLDKKLYRLPLNGTPPVTPASATAIPDPGCDRPDDWRPFALGFDRPANQLYVGGVCSSEFTQDRLALKAVVYRVGDPAGSPSFTPVLTVPLTYERIDPYRDNSSRWQPWPTATSIKPPNTILAPPQNGRGTRGTANVRLDDESYPQLGGIAFDGGSMILAFRDLMGDMSGSTINNEASTSNPNGRGASVTVQGDLLRAAPSGNGFVLESAGRVPPAPAPDGVQGFGISCPANPTRNAAECYGALGPGGGYFYDPHPGLSDQTAPSPFQGGALQVPGFRDVMTTSVDVMDPLENGFLWYDNDTGRKTRRVQNVLSDAHLASPGEGGFAKANGLGDLDAYVARAPVQIGNRLWYDEDIDGIQDTGEQPVVGTIVELLDANGIVIDNTRTDSQGEYVFQIAPDTAYTVRVPLDQPALEGWYVTSTTSGDDARIDNNGTDRNGYSVATVSPHAPGHNDHSYDFGFIHNTDTTTTETTETTNTTETTETTPTTPTTPTTTPTTPPPPSPPADQPAPPEQPAYAGASDGTPRRTPIVLVKYLSKGAAGSRQLQFGMVVRNGGARDLSGIQVCDRLPSILDYLGATRLARRLAGRRVCWRFATLPSGAARKLHVTTSVRGAVLLGTIINTARATGRHVRPAVARAIIRKHRRPKVTG